MAFLHEGLFSPLCMHATLEVFSGNVYSIPANRPDFIGTVPILTFKTSKHRDVRIFENFNR